MVVLTASVLSLRPDFAAAATCTSLASLTLPETRITGATDVPAGPYKLPDQAPAAPPVELPAHCRVTARTAPAIRFEVWLPASEWNGKFMGVGNGATGGRIAHTAMATALRRGYAVASTDTGHENRSMFDVSWARGRQDLLSDFGYRSVHLMTEHAKRIVAVFYETASRYSYFVGCSKGGQQGLMEAQRYPRDYDGIIAGAPAHDWTRFYGGGHLWYALVTQKDPESYIPPYKIALIANAVNAACDANDGVEDGVLEDPRRCRFDPEVLSCRPGQDAASCLTPKQVKAVKAIWAGARTTAGDLVYPGLLPGGEAGPQGWELWITGSPAAKPWHLIAGEEFFRHAIFEDPRWQFDNFNLDRDLPRSLTKVGQALDAVDHNLDAFERRGGKLIAYHGWSDPDISPLGTIRYFDGVVARAARGADPVSAVASTQRFFRLFMVPGMQHCTAGPGPDSFDMLTVLERWVEQGHAPDRVVASKVVNGLVERTRPLCVYPEVAEWDGMGSTNEADSFACVAPRAP